MLLLKSFFSCFGDIFSARKTLKEFIGLNILTMKLLSTLVQYPFLFINTSEIPGELLRENVLSSHVERSPLLWLHKKSSLSKRKVKWFGISLVFI